MRVLHAARTRALKAAIKPIVPVRARSELFRFRRLGASKYVEYTRLERAERRKAAPLPGKPYDIGAGSPIIMHSSTVPTVRSHWIDYGHAIKEFRAFKRLAPDHEVLFDVGAAEGIFSAAFCALTGRTSWAFEPSPVMFQRFSDLRALNPELRIVAFNIALGETAGSQRVREYTDGQFSAVGVQDGDAHEMAVTTLDAVVQAHGTAPDLVKVDVEGMELAVLAGATETLTTSVKTIILEVHYDALAERGEAVDDIERALADTGFELWSLDFERITHLRPYVASEPEMIPGYTIVIARRQGQPLR
jgi:FkbM family methyltransferase